MNATLRAMLFVPGADERRLAKIPQLPASSFILDLEDAVAAEAMARARELVAAALREHGEGRALWVRVNGVESGLLEDDVAAVAGPWLAGIVLPKARSADDVRLLGGLVDCELIPTIEDAAALARAAEIGAASPRVRCLGFGAADLAVGLGVEWPAPDGHVNPTLALAKAQLVLASAAAGLEPPHDGASALLDDLDALRREAEQARRLGVRRQARDSPGAAAGDRGGLRRPGRRRRRPRPRRGVRAQRRRGDPRRRPPRAGPAARRAARARPLQPLRRPADRDEPGRLRRRRRQGRACARRRRPPPGARQGRRPALVEERRAQQARDRARPQRRGRPRRRPPARGARRRAGRELPPGADGGVGPRPGRPAGPENRGLVYVRVTGFGQTGPLAAQPGFGTLAEAFSGFAYITGQPDGPPTLPPFGLADGVAGQFGTWATLVALYWRDVRGGEGQVIDLSLYEPLFSILGPQLAEHQHLGVVQQRQGNRSRRTSPRNAYRTADGRWVAISAGTQQIVDRVLRAIDRPDLVGDPRFADAAARRANGDDLDALVASWIAAHPLESVLDGFAAAEAPIAPVYDIGQIREDRQYRERGSFVEQPDPDLGTVAMPAVVPRLSRTPGSIRRTGPTAVGADTDAFLQELDAEWPR